MNEKKTRELISSFNGVFGVKSASLEKVIKDFNQISFFNKNIHAAFETVVFSDLADSSQNKDNSFNKSGWLSSNRKKNIANEAEKLHKAYLGGGPILFTNPSKTLICFWGDNFSTTHLNVPFFGRGAFESKVYAIQKNKEVTPQHLTKLMSAETLQETNKAIKNTGLVALDKKGRPIVETSFNVPIVGDKALYQGGHQLLLEAVAPIKYMDDIKHRKSVSKGELSPSDKHELMQDAWDQKMSIEWMVKAESIWQLEMRLNALRHDLENYRKKKASDKERQHLEKEIANIKEAIQNVINVTVNKYIGRSDFNPGAVFFDINFITCSNSNVLKEETRKNIKKLQANSVNEIVDASADEIFFDDPEMNFKELMKKEQEEEKEKEQLRQGIFTLILLDENKMDLLGSGIKDHIMDSKHYSGPELKDHSILQTPINLTKDGQFQGEEPLLNGLKEVAKMVRETGDLDAPIEVSIQEGSAKLQMPPVSLYAAIRGALLSHRLRDQRIKQGQKLPEGFSLQFKHWITHNTVGISSEPPELDYDPRLD